jgi:hypothetical protein
MWALSSLTTRLLTTAPRRRRNRHNVDPAATIRRYTQPMPASPPPSAPCPVCRSAHRLVLNGALCFVCERAVAREAANGMPELQAWADKHARFHDWLIEHKRA